MVEINQLVKELRIDWEDIFSESFNPLLYLEHGPSTSTFRDCYHRVEQCMESVIDAKYQNFTDTISSYREKCGLISECINFLSDITDQIKVISVEVDLVDLNRKYKQFVLLNNISDIIIDINNLRNKFYSLEKHVQLNNFNDGVNLIKNIDIGFMELRSIPALSDVFSEIVRIRQFILGNLFSLVAGFIFEDVFDRSMVRCIIALDGLVELDKYLVDNTSGLYYKHIEEIILSNKTLTVIIRRIFLYTENILVNYKQICRLLSPTNKENNFFEVDDEKLSVLGIGGYEKVKNIIFLELKRMIKSYLEVRVNKHTSFSLSNIDDVEVEKEEYTLIIPPSIELGFVFYEHIGLVKELKKELDEYLKRKLQRGYLRQRESSVKRKVFEMLRIYQSNFLDGFSDLMKTYFYECKRVGITSKTGFLFIFENVYNRFIKEIKEIFKCEIVLECVFSEDGSLQIDPINILKRKILVKKIDPQTLSLKKIRVENVLQSLNEVIDIYICQMHEYEVLKRDDDVESLLIKFKTIDSGYNTALRIERLVDVICYFDLFFREGNFLVTHGNAMNRIVKFVDQIEEKTELVELINYYIKNNIKKLNVRNQKGMDGFIGHIRLLDEIMGGLEESIEFLNKQKFN